MSAAESLVARARDWLLGGNTVVRAGVLVLFIGLAFLARYAVEHSLLPPALRLAAIAAAGIALFGAGLRLRRAGPGRQGYALTLQGAGVGVLYLAVFAAFRLYQYLPASAAFVLLALVCAFSAAIALAQNAQAMAFIGFAGGFAAPLLVSTGQGSHVALFSYYAVLGTAIAAIAWFKPWRALNLLGFFATFGIATAWGVLRWQPAHYASTQPFLLLFFALYLATALLYGLRHAHARGRAVDATLVFGVPIAGFGLQAALVRGIPYATAFSALALGAIYLALAAWLARAARAHAGELSADGLPVDAARIDAAPADGGQAEAAVVRRWLAQCFAILGAGFVTLAVPLALDERWTAAVWAVEGLAVYWMGRRQERWLPRATGIALQVLGALFYLDSLEYSPAAALPLANARFVGAVLLAGAALGIAWFARSATGMRPSGTAPSALARGFERIEALLSPVLFWVGFGWLQLALHGEIDRYRVGPDGTLAMAFGPATRLNLGMLAWVGCAFALHHLALRRGAGPRGATPAWPVAATPAWTVLPVLLVYALSGMFRFEHLLQGGGWLAWPLAVALHVLMLRRLDDGPPRRWWPWVHAGGVWLAVLLAGHGLVFALDRARLWQTDWAAVVLVVAASLVLLALASRRAFSPATRWPLDRFAPAYLWRAAAPLALLLALGALLVAVIASGNARPLPYLPLLNPVDLGVALALGACAAWLQRLRASTLPVPGWARGPLPPTALAFAGFVAFNTAWARVAHHFGGVRWEADALFASFLVQAGYSILWTLLALGLMVAANRRGWRTGWMVGAGLLAVTVLKLFVVDLSNRGGSERIVVFIAVGLLMLVVGWFAPLPAEHRASREQPA